MMFSIFVTFIVTVSVLFANGANVLVINPYVSHSHFGFAVKLADILADEGHNVTMVINELDTKLFAPLPKKGNVIIRSAFSSSPQLHGTVTQSFWNDGYDIVNGKKLMNEYMEEMRAQCERLLTDTAFVEKIKADHYDIAMIEPTDFCGYGLLKLIGLKEYVNIIPMSLSESIALDTGLPGRNYDPYPETFDNHPGLSYFERFVNYVLPIIRCTYQSYEQHGVSASVVRKYVDPEFTGSDAVGNARFTFLNTEEHIDFPRPISHKIIYVGGITVPQSSADELPEDYKKIYDKSKKGVVMISFGSIAKSSGMTERIRQAFVAMFAAFPEISFIWKFENVTDPIANDLPNVFKKTWVPQTKILAHPKTLVFFTHGGMNSIIESALAGVPLIGTPLFGDQQHNVKMVEYRKIAIYMGKQDLTKEKLIAAMHKLTDDDSYKKRAQTIAALARTKPMSGKQRFISYFNHAVQFVHAEDHLDIAHRKLNTFWYYNLDIYGTIAVIGIVLVALLLKIVFIVFSYFSNTIFKLSATEKKKLN